MRYFLALIVSISLFAKEYTIGFAQDTLSNDWRVAQVQEVVDEAKKYPFLKLIVKDANGKVANQIRNIQRFIDQGIDFIITSPKDAKVISLVLKKAMDKGIKVILISRTIESDDYTTFIAPDNYLIGQNAAKYLANHLGKKVLF